MSITIQISDQTLTGNVLGSQPLELTAARITLRELIRRRVYEEVMEFQAGRRTRLIEPASEENVLNGHRPTPARKIDWESQADLAIKAFQRHSYFVTVDDRQVEDLDEDLDLSLDSQVAFVKLIPMVGG